MKIFTWILRLVAAGILLQTLYFKFGAHPESVDLCTLVGVETWGSVGSGLVDVMAGGVVCVAVCWGGGALWCGGVLVGGCGWVGVVVGCGRAGDGGTLFFMAIIVLICALILAFLEKDHLIKDLKRITG